MNKEQKIPLPAPSVFLTVGLSREIHTEKIRAGDSALSWSAQMPNTPASSLLKKWARACGPD